jgi:Flp pilus assembly pilin Flp
MERARVFLRGLWRDESGISSVEYALLLAFIASGIIFAAQELANAVENQMEETATCISSAGDTC